MNDKIIKIDNDIRMRAIKITLLQITILSAVLLGLFSIYVLRDFIGTFVENNLTYLVIFIAIYCLFALYQINLVSIQSNKSAWTMRDSETPPNCEFINVEVRGQDRTIKMYFNRKTKQIDFSDDALEPVISYLPVTSNRCRRN